MIVEINRRVDSIRTPPDLADCAVFVAYAATALDDPSLLVRANALASAAIEGVPELEDTGLFDGLVGVAWAIEHLVGGRTLGEAHVDGWDDDPALDVHDALLVETLRPESVISAELAYGRSGHGVFIQERAHNGRKNAHRLLGAIVDRIETDAIESELGMRWRRAEESSGDDSDLGLAHGVAGVVAFLAGVVAHGHRPRNAARLLDGGVRWLLSQRLEDGGFPGRVPVDESAPQCRLGWCYGELSVAWALWQAGRAVACEAWQTTAIDVARHAAARDEQAAGVIDTGLCHGSAGLAHMFNVLYQHTGDEALGDAARGWLGWTMRSLEADGLKGSSWSMLEGLTGVGLMLASATSSVPPAWGARLLLDPVPSRSLVERGLNAMPSRDGRVRDVRLVPMSPERYEVMVRMSVEHYAEQLVRARGIELPRARQRARQELEQALPQGMETPGALLLDIISGEVTVGYMRFGTMDRPRGKVAFAYDFQVDSEHRGAGIIAMVKAFAMLQDMGCRRVSLQVFGDNPRTMRLYQRVGFRIDSYTMSRDLSGSLIGDAEDS